LVFARSFRFSRAFDCRRALVRETASCWKKIPVNFVPYRLARWTGGGDLGSTIIAREFASGDSRICWFCATRNVKTVSPFVELQET
jgi:hypothetical protein